MVLPRSGRLGCGAWPAELADTHINPLESLASLAALTAVSSVCPPSTSVTIHSRLDNTVAVSVIDRRRGAAGPLARLARHFAFLAASLPHIHPSSSHVKGVDNPVADGLSRGLLPTAVAGFTFIGTPPAWMVSTLSCERPWHDLVPPRRTPPA